MVDTRRQMVDFQYLYRGICGLARASKAGNMAGHLGAAVVAGYFFGEDQSELPQGVFQGVEGELDRIIAGEEAFWFDPQKTGVTPSGLFEPFPDQPADPDSIAMIIEALEKNVGTLKQSGHNTIFASIAVRALHDHQDYATPLIVAGIRNLIAGFDHASPGHGYFGKVRGWLSGHQVTLLDDSDFPAYQSVHQMVDITIQELINTAAIRKQGFGGLWHIINHAAAITELDRIGYKQLATLGLPAHHQHIRLWRSLPNVEDELGAVIKADHDPRQEIYWDGTLKRDEARLTHRIKTLYGFYTIRRFIEDDSIRKKAEEAFLYLMA